METDLILAILHHLLVFAMAAILAAELVIVRPGLERNALGMLGRIDSAYGMVAILVVLVGIGRVLYGLRGWEYYVYYWAFWAKMAAFVMLGLLSIKPTMRIIQWRRSAASEPAFVVPDGEVANIRTFLKAQALVFLLIPSFAAVMARAVGY